MISDAVCAVYSENTGGARNQKSLPRERKGYIVIQTKYKYGSHPRQAVCTIIPNASAPAVSGQHFNSFSIISHTNRLVKGKNRFLHTFFKENPWICAAIGLFLLALLRESGKSGDRARHAASVWESDRPLIIYGLYADCFAQLVADEYGRVVCASATVCLGSCVNGVSEAMAP